MKRILYILTALAVLLCSCESFLDTENLTKKDTSNFPASPTDAEQLVTGIYSAMNNLLNDYMRVPFYVFEMAGDDRLGGSSGTNAADRLMVADPDYYAALWKYHYRGIYRANNALETIPNVTGWDSDKTRDRLLGESHFLRAHYYFELALVFGQVPLVLSTDPENKPKATPDEIYAQIGYDLQQAITLMPSEIYSTHQGHATKWAAEALMSRAFLFYTGYYGKSTLPLAEGGEVTKQQVISWVEDCIKNSGHELVSDQRNLWPYSNEYTSKDYKYGKENGLCWEGDGNKETIFALKFSNTGKDESNEKRGYCNRIQQAFGLRKAGSFDKDAFPFCFDGYGEGPVSRELWDSWGSDPDYAGDYRRTGSICDRKVEIPKYPGLPTKETECTEMFAKKYIDVGAKEEGNSKPVMYSYLCYGSENHKVKGANEDIVYIRLADVLLMHSELTGTADGLNKVRQRAGLAPITYSLSALKKERKYELCFEGVRWNDLRRWGDVEQIERNQAGQKILNKGHDDFYKFSDGDLGFMARYKATGGFFPIPHTQITLSEGVLVQNEGWNDTRVLNYKHPYTTF